MKLSSAVGIAVAGTASAVVFVFFLVAVVVVKCCVVRLRSDQSEIDFRDLELALNGKKQSLKEFSETTDEVGQHETPLEQEPDLGLTVLEFDPIELESFDRQTDGLGDDEQRYERMNLTGRRVDRLSAIKLVNYCGCSISTLNQIDKNARSVYAHYFSLYDRSLVVQNMAQEVLNGPKAVTEIRDQHSSGVIKVGSMVIVKTPFTGTKRNLEFESLEPGQILKVVKFFVKNQVMDNVDDRSSLYHSCHRSSYQRTSDLSYRAALDRQISTERDLKEAGLISPCPTIEPEVLELEDPYYPHIWCSGALFRTYLHHDKATGIVQLKYRSDETSKYQMVRDFPISCVTLESNFLNHESTESDEVLYHDSLEFHEPDELYISSEETMADLCEHTKGMHQLESISKQDE